MTGRLHPIPFAGRADAQPAVPGQVRREVEGPAGQQGGPGPLPAAAPCGALRPAARDYSHLLGARHLLHDGIGGAVPHVFLSCRQRAFADMAVAASAGEASQLPSWFAAFIGREAQLLATTAALARGVVTAGHAGEEAATHFLAATSADVLAWAQRGAVDGDASTRVLPIAVSVASAQGPHGHHCLFLELDLVDVADVAWLRATVDDSNPFVWSEVSAHADPARRRIQSTQIVLPRAALAFPGIARALTDLSTLVAPDLETFARRLARVRALAQAAASPVTAAAAMDLSRPALTSQLGPTCLLKNHNAGIRARLALHLRRLGQAPERAGGESQAAWRWLRAYEREHAQA